MTASSSQSGSISRHLFSTTVVEFILYLLLALIIVGLMNLHALWTLLLNHAAGPVRPEEIAPVTDRFIHFQDKLNTPVFLAFWGGIGLVAYGIVWLVGTSIDISRREVAESRYKTSGVAAQSHYWRQTSLSNARFIAILVGFIAYVYLCLRTTLPWAATTFHRGLKGGDLSRQLIDLIGPVIIIAISLYGLIILHRLLKLVWQSIKS